MIRAGAKHVERALTVLGFAILVLYGLGWKLKDHWSAGADLTGE